MLLFPVTIFLSAIASAAAIAPSAGHGTTPNPGASGMFHSAVSESLREAVSNHASVMATKPLFTASTALRTFPRRLGALAASSTRLSAGCAAAGRSWNENHKAKCEVAFDVFGDKTLDAASRTAALCGEGKCIATLRALLFACRNEIKEVDPSGNLETGAYIINGIAAMCPNASNKEGCFASAATYGDRISRLDFSNGKVPTDEQLETVCGDRGCTARIFGFLLSAARRAGASEEAIRIAEAHVRGQELLCLRRANGKLCYSALRAATDNGPDPTKVCPDPCVRRGYKLLVDLIYATNSGLSKDYAVLISMLCKYNEDKKMCFKFINGDYDKERCKEGEAQVLQCGAKVEAADDTCKGKIVVDGKVRPTQDAPCSCLVKMATCEIETINPRCLEGFYKGCTTSGYVRAECQAQVCEPLKQFEDPCEAITGGSNGGGTNSSSSASSTAVCTDACKARAEASVAEWGCCLGEIVATSDKISGDGDLREFKGFATVVRTVQQKCSLDASLLTKTCRALGRVTGKAVLRGLAKAIVDRNPSRFYAKFAEDLSDNTGVAVDDISVTGHAEVSASTTRQAASAGTQAGVAFEYEISTEDAQAAEEVKGTLDAEIGSGSLDLPALQAEVAKEDPGAQLLVDGSASTTTAVDLAPTPTPGSNSTATAVAASGAVVLLSTLAVLA